MSGDACDKCGKPLSEDDPGLHLREHRRGENMHVMILHVECLQQVLFAARKEHITKVIADFKQVSKAFNELYASEVPKS